MQTWLQLLAVVSARYLFAPAPQPALPRPHVALELPHAARAAPPTASVSSGPGEAGGSFRCWPAVAFVAAFLGSAGQGKAAGPGRPEAPGLERMARRSVLAAAAAVLPLHAAHAFDLPALAEYDNPSARKYAAGRPNPNLAKQQSSAFYSVTVGDNATLEAMVENGWDLAACKDSAGKTVLHRAAQVGNARAVELLLKAGAPVDALTSFQETPLFLAVRTNHLDCVKLLVAAGASPSKANTGGDTALILAQKYKYASVVEYLSAL